MMKHYVVGLLFDNELNHVLMLKRIKEPFKNLYNGVGGKVEPNEQPIEAMVRELEEETGLIPSELSKIEYLVTLNLEEDIRLDVYYFILKKEITSTFIVYESEEGTLEWLSIQKDNVLDASNPLFAGDGNIAYFIQLALTKERKSYIHCTEEAEQGMSFYRFAITFRHGHEGISYKQHSFANTIIRDKWFPKKSSHYSVLKKYVEQHYAFDCNEGFEEIWVLYQKSCDYYKNHKDRGE